MPMKQLYYPKDKVSKPLIAEAGEFVYEDDNKPYVGPYVIANGLYLTGQKVSKTSKFIKLLSDRKNVKRTTKNTSRYLELTGKEFDNHTSPSIHFPKPTAEDYQKRQFQRYFAQKKNEPILIKEISKEQYELANRQNEQGIDLILYNVFEIQWMLKGKDAVAINRANVQYASIEFPGIQDTVKNLSQFVREKQTPDRFYPDGELINKNLPAAYGFPSVGALPNSVCSNCKFVQNNYCRRWQAQIRLNYWCKSYKKYEVNLDSRTN